MTEAWTAGLLVDCPPVSVTEVPASQTRGSSDYLMHDYEHLIVKLPQLELFKGKSFMLGLGRDWHS